MENKKPNDNNIPENTNNGSLPITSEEERKKRIR
jgi:hypothetical protein